jgi:pimeloyl-ACP methyl ester carboxylesterase
LGVGYCTFDFSGCGNSQGDKISFGSNEKYDVEDVISKLKSEFFLNRFIFWGRSMGSVCAIKYCELMHQKYPLSANYRDEILGLVLDSAFKSFSKLVVEIGNTKTDVPKFLIKGICMLYD